MSAVACVSSSEYGLRDDECVWVTRFRIDEGAVFGSHGHPQAQLVWPAGGQMVVEVEGRRWVLAASQAVWLPGDVEHEIRVTRDADMYSVYLWDEECGHGWTAPTPIRMGALARELVRYLAREDLDDAAARRARATLLDVLQPVEVASIDLPMPNDPRARRVAVSVLAEPGLPHTLQEWSRRLHTSEKTIQRAFSVDTGMTFSEWRTQARLYRALPLLAESVPVSAVAGRIGYTSVNGFAAAFRSRFGTTPGAFYAR